MGNCLLLYTVELITSKKMSEEGERLFCFAYSQEFAYEKSFFCPLALSLLRGLFALSQIEIAYLVLCSAESKAAVESATFFNTVNMQMSPKVVDAKP